MKAEAPMFGKNSEEETYRMGQIAERYIVNINSTKQTLFTATIRLDNKEVYIEKKEFTMIDLIALVGGLGTSI